MHLNLRPCITALLAAALALITIVGDAMANRVDGALKDTFYFSPSWDYSVRWYADEWSVAEESSQDGADKLVLENAAGASVRFEGHSAFHGDSRACLDEQFAALESEGAENIAVIQDDMQRPQKIYHPLRSWMLLIAAMPVNGNVADQAIYLDCRTLQYDDSVFIRELRMPAEAFASDLILFDVLNAALPHVSWSDSSPTTVVDPAIQSGWTDPPLPADTLLPWEYPTLPRIFSRPDGPRGMITVVDGNLAKEDFVIVIENIGDTTLVIDPAQFMVSNVPWIDQVDLDVTALSAVWTDGTAPGSRSIPPGEFASLLLHFIPPTESAGQMSLMFWDQGIEDGGIPLVCFTSCGYGGGGSRPNLRAIR